LSLSKDMGSKRKRKGCDNQLSTDREGGFDGGDFSGEGGGASLGFIVDVGVGIIARGGNGGRTVGGSLCCMSMFTLNSIESLKDLSEAFKVFLISILIFMRSARNLFSVVSFRLACYRCNISWIISSNTPVGATTTKRVI